MPNGCSDRLPIGLEVIAAAEPEVADAIVGELESQRRQLKLIASENMPRRRCCSPGKLVLDKYAEGTPAIALRRVRNGRPIETLAADHAKALFSAEHA